MVNLSVENPFGLHLKITRSCSSRRLACRRILTTKLVPKACTNQSASNFCEFCNCPISRGDWICFPSIREFGFLYSLRRVEKDFTPGTAHFGSCPANHFTQDCDLLTVAVRDAVLAPKMCRFVAVSSFNHRVVREGLQALGRRISLRCGFGVKPLDNSSNFLG